MSALDDAYKAAAVAFSKSAEGKYGINHPYYKQHLEAAIPVFLAHLADDPPDEMVWVATEALVQPHSLRRLDVSFALSAALRSIIQEKTNA